jgi:integrase
MLLLTGARLNEVLQTQWAWLDINRRIIALPDSKTGAKPLYLSVPALEVLEDQRRVAGDSKLIFPSPQNLERSVNLRGPWSRLCAQVGFVGVRLHDLRHTAASVAAGSGVSLPIIGRLLGHSQMQTTQRYAHIGNDPALGAANIIANGIADKIALP